MNEEPFILDIDLNKQAVIEPGVEDLQYKFLKLESTKIKLKSCHY